MCEDIRSAEDIDRVNCGAYSPNARDRAQRARDHIYHMLRDISGKETFDALMNIAQAAPNEQIKAWQTKQAITRAEADADTSWQICQVDEFEAQLECTPSTPRDLFDIAVQRLLDLKQKYEDGNFSHANVVIKAEREPELRSMLSGNLQRRSNGRYSISQEDEMPNKQRTDIRFVHVAVQGMVPIELKIADNWTGPQLFDKLRNQLCRDYLRDTHSKNGIFLLVSRGTKQHWAPSTKKQVNFEGLIDALQNHGRELLATDQEIRKATMENIKVVGTDLSRRNKKPHAQIGTRPPSPIPPSPIPPAQPGCPADCAPRGRTPRRPGGRALSGRGVFRHTPGPASGRGPPPAPPRPPRRSPPS